MKTCCLLLILLAAFLAPASSIALAAQPTESAPATNTGAKAARTGTQAEYILPNEQTYPRSQFEILPKAKDPFFPRSTRFNAPSPVTPDKPKTSTDFVSLLTLNGVSGQSHGRLAIINGRTFGVEEEAEVKVKTTMGKLKVKCLEIRETSAIVSVENQSGTLELKLRN